MSVNVPHFKAFEIKKRHSKSHIGKIARIKFPWALILLPILVRRFFVPCCHKCTKTHSSVFAKLAENYLSGESSKFPKINQSLVICRSISDFSLFHLLLECLSQIYTFPSHKCIILQRLEGSDFLNLRLFFFCDLSG